MLNSVEKYINDGEVQRTKIALDVADGSISSDEIKGLCSDQRIKDAFIGTSYNNKQPKETWNVTYRDQLVCAAAAECFNQDYLLYLAEVGASIEEKKSRSNGCNMQLLWGVIAAIAIVVVVTCIVIWKAGNSGQ